MAPKGRNSSLFRRPFFLLLLSLLAIVALYTVVPRLRAFLGQLAIPKVSCLLFKSLIEPDIKHMQTKQLMKGVTI